MFDTSSRIYRAILPTLTKPSGGGTVTMQLPKTGLAARLYLLISATISGSLSGLNALGAASIIKNVKVTLNGSTDVVSISGAGYHYLYRYMQGLYLDPVPQATARNAVSATTFNLDMVLDLMVNQSDPIGCIMLQNDQTTVTLAVQFEADTTVATGATVTATVVPVLEYFAVPARAEDYPPLNYLHTVLEDQQSISGAGDFTYNWARAHTYLGVYHGCALAQSASDSWSRAKLRVNQSTYLEDYTTAAQDAVFAYTHGIARRAGNIFFDFMGSSGMGVFAKSRDVVNSGNLTDIATVITATGAATLTTVRRQIMQLQ